MCQRLGRKRLQELGMLDYKHLPFRVDRVPHSNPKTGRRHARRTKLLVPRNNFGLYIHEKGHYAPHRPLFFNYLTRLAWEASWIRATEFGYPTNDDAWKRVVTPAKKARAEKLEKYDHRARTGWQVYSYSKGSYAKRIGKLHAQGIRINPSLQTSGHRGFTKHYTPFDDSPYLKSE